METRNNVEKTTKVSSKLGLVMGREYFQFGRPITHAICCQLL